MLTIEQAATPADVEIVRQMMLEYQTALGISLCFQGFDAEVLGLPGSYAPPRGRLLLARLRGVAVGCVALHELGWPRAEMKRLFVRPSARGLGVGRALVSEVIDQATAIGYTEIVLDTLPSMVEAQKLYEQFGFGDIAPYRENPIEGARYLSKALRQP